MVKVRKLIMKEQLKSIKEILTLEKIEKNIFRGQSQNIGTPQVYGGQVLGQAIAAAQLTVEDQRPVHSAHAYFLRKGDFNAPIIYDVDRNREGRSFTSRRVVAIQHGNPIFTLAASFQTDEPGMEYETGIDLPDIELSLVLPKPAEAEIKAGKIHPTAYFDIRHQPDADSRKDNSLGFWLKTKDPLADMDANLHREVLAYISDLGLLYSALVPHGYSVLTRRSRSLQELSLASIDHAIWYHRPFSVDQWLYYKCDPISTSGARGLARGAIYTQQGVLIASTMQEGLMRKIPIDDEK